jgi:TonB family protein
MPFSLGTTSPTVTHPAPARARPPGRGVDLSFATRGAGATRLSINGLLDRDGVGPDWANAFRAWLDRHTYYPRDAGALGEQGEVVVTFVVAKDGRVSALQLVGSSGHPLLDTATLAMFRDATLPPLPPQDGARLPVRFTMRYVIVPR